MFGPDISADERQQIYLLYSGFSAAHPTFRSKNKHRGKTRNKKDNQEEDPPAAPADEVGAADEAPAQEVRAEIGEAARSMAEYQRIDPRDLTALVGYEPSEPDDDHKAGVPRKIWLRL